MSDTITSTGIDLVLGLAPAKLLPIDGYTYIDKDRKVELFIPPTPKTLAIHTLSGFVKLLEIGFEAFSPELSFVLVSAFDTVELLSATSDSYGRRQLYAISIALKPERQFAFNSYIGQEQFNIALRSMFVQNDELNTLIQLSGNIAEKTELRQEDDGFSQTVSSKAGTWLNREITLKPRVTLKPFRTFTEVEQPSGDFIFRVRNREGVGNECALFEADAGAWKLTAMNTIQAWLKQQITTSDALGIREIPVLA